MKTKIAPAPSAFEGAPQLNAASVYGAATGKPFLLKLPAFGKRPVTFSASGLPESLSLDAASGIISGILASDGEFTFTARAKNALGQSEKEIRLVCADNLTLVTPMLAFCSWNAFTADVSDEKIRDTAKRLCESGLAECGFSYVNIDSGWQGERCPETGAILPNGKFPDMKALCDYIHSLGLHAGIYSTPMSIAWGAPGLPGGTSGEQDPRFADAENGLGVEHHEAADVRLWSGWGFDYLKYDWIPTDRFNAGLMKLELNKAPRVFGFCVTGKADPKDEDFWRENCSAWRDTPDSADLWSNIYNMRFTRDERAASSLPGHFFDLDMLECGNYFGRANQLPADEKLTAYTIRIIFPSPIQISAPLETLDEDELAMLMNTEVLAVNQDAMCAGAERVFAVKDGVKEVKAYIKPLADGTRALALFNLGDTDETFKLSFASPVSMRDLWARENTESLDRFTIPLCSHCTRLFKINSAPEIAIS